MTTLTKGNLLTGDMLVHRNGKKSTVMLGTVIGDVARYHTEFNSFSYLSNINEDLTHTQYPNLDIVAVYRTFNPDRSKSGDAIANPDKMICPDNLVWTRPDDDVADESNTCCGSCAAAPNYDELLELVMTIIKDAIRPIA